jgi:hypothetical protein
MPRLRVIILDKSLDDPDTFNLIFWVDVPAARQQFYADANKVSAWRNATTPDNDALKSGAVVEKSGTTRHVKGTNMAQVQIDIQTQWQAYQDYVNASNPWQRQDSTWDGTSWVVTNNP